MDSDGPGFSDAVEKQDWATRNNKQKSCAMPGQQYQTRQRTQLKSEWRDRRRGKLKS